MHAPISMLVGPGNSKAVAVIVVLAGLFAVAAFQRQQATTQTAR
jgi:hypothetical protein